MSRLVLLMISLVTLVSGCADKSQLDRWSYDFSDEAPTLFQDDFTLCVIGDAGTGKVEQYAVAEAMTALQCSQVRYVGDVIYPKGVTSIDDELFDTNFNEPYAALLDRGVRFNLVMGNHDWNPSPQPWIDYAASRDTVFYPNYFYSERWGDVCFFSLETTWYNKLYFLHKRATETAWLEHQYKEMAADCQFSMAFGHHPLYSSGHHGDAGILERGFLEDHIQGRVDLYITGHDHHLADEGKTEDTQFLISGSGGRLYPLGDEPNDAANYAVSARGFMQIKFLRNVQGKPFVRYQIVEVDVEAYEQKAKEFWSLTWSGEMQGLGLR